MELYIKNMVCSRCKMVVHDEFIKLGLHPIKVELGEVTIKEALSDVEKNILSVMLSSFGFELIDSIKGRIIERIKVEILNVVRYSQEIPKNNLSEILSDKLNYEYNYLSNLFSEITCGSIERYYIAQKIEFVKELLIYNELSLSEIALKLNYGSVSYLSKQFKKKTGLTPSHFKQLKVKIRIPLEEL